MKTELILKSEEETLRLGEKIARSLKGGAFLALEGELGAGKTVLVRGMARALHVRSRVTSPTFTVMNQYTGDRELCHFDLYRVTEDDCIALGFDDFFYDETVLCAVEWSERLSEKPKKSLTVTLTVENENERRAVIDDPLGLLEGWT